MSLKIDQISPTLLRELDVALPNWKDLVPEDKASELNEETLIQLLKDRKRAEIYRVIADKRDQMFKDVYEGSDQSFWDLARTMAEFGYERMAHWWEIEGKLNSIILEFRAKGKIKSAENLRPSLNSLKTEIGKVIDSAAKSHNSYIDASKNNSINEISGGDEEITRELNSLFNTQIGRFKQDNSAAFDDIKKFIYEENIGLIEGKISKIEGGELSIDALQRSDLFTDEEIISLETKQEQVVEKILTRRRKVNVDSFNDMMTRSGFSGKSDFLAKINELPEDVMSSEAKKSLQEAISVDFILPWKQSARNRSKRLDANTIASILLASSAGSLKQAAKQQKKHQQLAPKATDNSFYKWCNSSWWAAIKHIITVGACSGHTLTAAIIDAAVGHPVDWNGIANVLGFVSFMISGPASVIEKIVDFAMGEAISAACDWAVDQISDYKLETAFFCTFLSSLAYEGVKGKISDKLNNILIKLTKP